MFNQWFLIDKMFFLAKKRLIVEMVVCIHSGNSQVATEIIIEYLKTFRFNLGNKIGRKSIEVKII